MVLNIMVIIKMVQNVEKVYLHFLMGQIIKDSLKIIVLMVKVFLLGLIKEFMKVIG
jgi:uncharacterized integral membrane protein